MSHDSEQNQRSALQHEAEHASPKKNSVLIYLVILFAAAFLLLLLSYFMQQRASREAYSDLQQSSQSAVQSLDNMLQENEDLKAQVEELTGENDRLQQELDQAQTQGQEAQTAQTRLEALNRLNQIRALYNSGKYSQARELLAAWEAETPGGVAAALGEVSASLTEEERAIYDPLEAWNNLNDWLN